MTKLLWGWIRLQIGAAPFVNEGKNCIAKISLDVNILFVIFFYRQLQKMVHDIKNNEGGIMDKIKK